MLPVFPLFSARRIMQFRTQLRGVDMPRGTQEYLHTIAKKSEGRGVGSPLICASGLEQVGHVAVVQPCQQAQPESSATGWLPGSPTTCPALRKD